MTIRYLPTLLELSSFPGEEWPGAKSCIKSDVQSSVKWELVKENQKFRQLSKASDWTIIMNQREANRLKKENENLKVIVEKMEKEKEVMGERVRGQVTKQCKGILKLPDSDNRNTEKIIKRSKTELPRRVTFKRDSLRLKISDSESALLHDNNEANGVNQLVKQLHLVKTRFEVSDDNSVDFKDDPSSYNDNGEDPKAEGVTDNDSTKVTDIFDHCYTSIEDQILPSSLCSVSLFSTNPYIRPCHLLSHVRHFSGVEDIRFDGKQASTIFFSSSKHARYFSEQQHKIGEISLSVEIRKES